MKNNNMSYQEKCQYVANEWEYKFNNTMTLEDHEEFQKDLEKHNAKMFDVFDVMEDYGNV